MSNKCIFCGETFFLLHKCDPQKIRAIEAGEQLAKAMKKRQEHYEFISANKPSRIRKLELKINNLEDYIKQLEELMVSHIVDDIKDMIDDINTKNRKIVKKMDLLTEAEKDEVINYLAETNQPIFNSS